MAILLTYSNTRTRYRGAFALKTYDPRSSEHYNLLSHCSFDKSFFSDPNEQFCCIKREAFIRKKTEQAGAELCQAQLSLKLVNLTVKCL